MIDRITLLLKTKNITASQFADEVGVQRSSVSHVLSGRNKPSLDFIQKILKKYPEINPDWLLFGKGAMNMEFNLFSEISDSIPVREEAIDKALKRQERPMRVVPEQSMESNLAPYEEEDLTDNQEPEPKHETVPNEAEIMALAEAIHVKLQPVVEQQDQAPPVQAVEQSPTQNVVQPNAPQIPYYPPYQMPPAPQYLYPPVNPYYQQPYQAMQQPFVPPVPPTYFQAPPAASQPVNQGDQSQMSAINQPQPTQNSQPEVEAPEAKIPETIEVKPIQTKEEFLREAVAIDKDIEKIMVFYKDKTFAVYKPE